MSGGPQRVYRAVVVLSEDDLESLNALRADLADQEFFEDPDDPDLNATAQYEVLDRLIDCIEREIT